MNQGMLMSQAQPRVVSIHYQLTNLDGDVLDSSLGGTPLSYLEGAENIIPGLEEALKELSTGDKVQVVIDPEYAYGLRKEELIQDIPIEDFEGVEKVETGMQFQMSTESGPHLVTVTQVQGKIATIDANHPLAGETLNFEVEVMETRQASSDEVDQGYVLI